IPHSTKSARVLHRLLGYHLPSSVERRPGILGYELGQKKGNIVCSSNHLWALVGDPSSRRTNTRQQQQRSGRPDLASREGRKPIPVVSADDASLLMKRRSYISAPERQRQ
ncbi:hypothetical protein BDDG_03695, partial [Blastomyces dermatitidis ATCC 18188]